MIDIPPTWFKKVQAKCEKEPDKLHVVFFDEINNALPSIQGMAFTSCLTEKSTASEVPRQREDRRRGQRHTGLFGGLSAGGAVLQQICPRIYQHHHRKMVEMGPENNIHPAIYAYIACKRGEPLRSEYTEKSQTPTPENGKWLQKCSTRRDVRNAARSHRRRHHR